MIDLTVLARARRLRAMHEGPVLVLPNAWDAASAALVAQAGARAVATTSGGVSWAAGCPDGEQLSRDEMMAAIRRIVDAVSVPVTADVEGGYGREPADVAATVAATLDAGAVGINIEDSCAADGTLWPAPAQAERIQAGRDAAAAAGIHEFVINARTDVYLRSVGDPAGRLDDVLHRAEYYAKAGADCLFVPGLTDLATVASLAAATPLPVNVLGGPGTPTVAEFAAAGARRVSVGTALAQAAYAAARRAAQELLQHGSYRCLESGIDYPELNALCTPPDPFAR